MENSSIGKSTSIKGPHPLREGLCQRQLTREVHLVSRRRRQHDFEGALLPQAPRPDFVYLEVESLAAIRLPRFACDACYTPKIRLLAIDATLPPIETAVFPTFGKWSEFERKIVQDPPLLAGNTDSGGGGESHGKDTFLGIPHFR